MSQGFQRGLENEYLLPYISFTTQPSGASIASGGSASLSAVATASTGIGYLTYKWYQNGSQVGSATTALSGVATTRTFTLDYSGSQTTRDLVYKVGAEWTPENPDIIVSHGTPGVGATGVGVGQSITGQDPQGQIFSSEATVKVSPTITVSGITTSGTDSGYNRERTLTADATVANGDNSRLAYQWTADGSDISGATSKSYVFTPGAVGITTYSVVVSYPPDSLVPDVTGPDITDFSLDLRQIVRLEFYPISENAANSSFRVFSQEYNLTDYPNGLKIDHALMRTVATSRNMDTYWWDRAFHVGMISVEDNLNVDIELGGCEGTQDGIDRGGQGGWTVISGTMTQNQEFFGTGGIGKIPSLGGGNFPTAVYELGSLIGVVGNGGNGGRNRQGGDGGADGAGETGGNGSGGPGGTYYSAGTLPTTGVINERLSRCPSGDSYFANRFSACQQFDSVFKGPDGFNFQAASGSTNSLINRGWKNMDNTNNFANGDNGQGQGGSGAVRGSNDNLRSSTTGNGGGGGSGYYSSSWTKRGAVRGGNDGSNRSWNYGYNDTLTQTVTTDGRHGYIRLFGRGGTAGNNTQFSDVGDNFTRQASVVRNPNNTVNGVSMTRSGLFLDLRNWPTSEDVLVRGRVTVNNSGHFIRTFLTDGGSFSYGLRGDSDSGRGNMGTTVFTLNENSGTRDQWLQGGKIYQFRSQDDSARRSGVYKGGEDQGGGAGRASGGDFDITIHDNGAAFGDNNTGGRADMASQWSIQGTRTR